MTDEIEELWKLADECREWAKTGFRPDDNFQHDAVDVQTEFNRLAAKLDKIARTLAARMPT